MLALLAENQMMAGGVSAIVHVNLELASSSTKLIMNDTIFSLSRPFHYTVSRVLFRNSITCLLQFAHQGKKIKQQINPHSLNAQTWNNNE